MAVLELSVLHGQYVRIADRFKAIWTFNQFVSGVYKNFLFEAVPYTYDFQASYERIKAAGGGITVAQAVKTAEALDASTRELDEASELLLHAEERIGPSLLRRFFEKLKRQDETIVFNLVKFYLYADAVEGDRRDKLDYLLTRIGEEFVEDIGEYTPRMSLELRDKFHALVSIMRRAEPPAEDIERVITAIHTMRDEVAQSDSFDDLTERNILKASRLLKHRIGDFYFHPDVLMAIVELNVATKNRFAKLYELEEQKILDNAQRLMEHKDDLQRDFGETNPALLIELEKFRQQKEQFDLLRAQSNVKHEVISQLKASMTSILAQIDRGLLSDEAIEIIDTPVIPEAFVDEAEHYQRMSHRFGSDEPLLRFLIRIASAIDPAGRGHSPEEVAQFPAVRELRIEPWEVGAFQKLFLSRPAETKEDTEELWITYMRAAALRIRINEEATVFSASIDAGVDPDAELMARTKESLELAKELEEQFGDILREAVYYSSQKMLRQLYRSRFRLLRAFSGLWLVYDQQVEGA